MCQTRAELAEELLSEDVRERSRDRQSERPAFAKNVDVAEAEDKMRRMEALQGAAKPCNQHGTSAERAAETLGKAKAMAETVRVKHKEEQETMMASFRCCQRRIQILDQQARLA